MTQPVPRYHFGEFVLSPRRRVLLRNGREEPLIPRYFDLLVFLIERRHEAVHRQDIFERVWSDVVVADSALSQAIRTLRRTLGDDPREPRFIRTVSRHGYRFVFEDVREEPDDAAEEDQIGLPGGALASPPWGRLRGAQRLAAARWAAASMSAGITGAFAGAAGGLILTAVPGTHASFAVVPVLALIGAACATAGGAGVGAGLFAAELAARSRRALALAIGGSLGGGLAGWLAQWLSRWSLETLVGAIVPIGGGLEGLVIGAGIGLACGLVTGEASEDAAAPRGRSRSRVVLATAAAGGLAALALTLAGRPLVAGTVHLIASMSAGSQAVLTPLARLLGEPEFGPITGALIGTAEGLLFGAGFGWGVADPLARRAPQA